MLEDDCRPHFISALRQKIGNPVPGEVAHILWGIEKMAADCLDDVIPPTLDRDVTLAHRRAGAPYSKPRWELTRADGPHSVGELLITLKSLYDSAENGEGRSPREKIRRWYAAAEVLRCCIDIRAHGLNQHNLNWLTDAMHGLPALPTAKVGKAKANSPALVEAPRPDTEEATTSSDPEAHDVAAPEPRSAAPRLRIERPEMGSAPTGTAHRADKQIGAGVEDPMQARTRLVIELEAHRVLIDGAVQVVPAQPLNLLVLLAQSAKNRKGPVRNFAIEESTRRTAKELVSELRKALKANRQNAEEIHGWIAPRRSFGGFELVLAPEQIEIGP